MLNPDELKERLDSLETDMNRLVAENTRLIQERLSVYVELDACISLVAQLAVVQGLGVGVVKNEVGNKVVVDLPGGQVSWEFAESESHLFANLPDYEKSVEDVDVIEKYQRVMNPGLQSQ